jgi:16S rRNA (cytidine1402-2'-O)-methyltransferase
MPATLFVVSTPIGNLEDVTLRALRTLREVAVVAAEDTRRTGHLLHHYQIATPMVSLHDHNEREKTPALLARLQAGDAVALVSDAGTPLLSDPGFHLVRKAVAAGIAVQCVPGASAVTAALAVSALPVEHFTFLGFPPARSGKRSAWFAGLKGQAGTLVFFEAPQRIHPMLADVRTQLGERFVVLARELTKIHETVTRGWVSELLARPLEQRGEYVVLVSDQIHLSSAALKDVSDEQLRAEFAVLTDGGTISPRDAVAELAERHKVPKQRIYKAARA